MVRWAPDPIETLPAGGGPPGLLRAIRPSWPSTSAGFIGAGHVGTALAVAMVVTAGGGYYPLYLGICLIVLTGAALWRSKRGQRRTILGRAVAVAVLAVALSAATLMPLADGLRYTARDAPPDPNQATSQPLPYALFNYVVADRTWFRADVLNKGIGWGWFYIGALPLLALAFTPWVFGRFRWRRGHILTPLALLLVLLLWQSSRYPPVSTLYTWLPFLTTFRFPNRLLIVAAIPLVTLAALASKMATAIYNKYDVSNSPLKVSLTQSRSALEKNATTLATSRAAAMLDKESESWLRRLPQDTTTWFDWLLEQPQEVVLSLIVFATANSAEAVQGRADSSDHAAPIARALSLDMADWWEPTAESYLDLVPKSKLLEAVTETAGAEVAAAMLKMKKEGAVAHAQKHLQDRRWLPAPLRAVEAVSA